MDAITAKALVLGLVVVAGMFCIFLGYRLYVLGVVEKGKIDASGVGAKIKLSDYGPGVAFALFGAGLLMFVAQDRFVSDRTTSEGAGKQPVSSPSTNGVPGPMPYSNAAPAPYMRRQEQREEARRYAPNEAPAPPIS